MPSCRYNTVLCDTLPYVYATVLFCRYTTILYRALHYTAFLPLRMRLVYRLRPWAPGPTVYRVRGQFVKFDLHFVNYRL